MAEANFNRLNYVAFKCKKDFEVVSEKVGCVFNNIC